MKGWKRISTSYEVFPPAAEVAVRLNKTDADNRYIVRKWQGLFAIFCQPTSVPYAGLVKPNPPRKTTPSNCKLAKCKYNSLPPPENSQECLACEGNKDPNWRYDAKANEATLPR